MVHAVSGVKNIKYTYKTTVHIKKKKKKSNNI